MRALAVLSVVFFHLGLGCPGGFIGVDIFFVISGFLITGLILKEMQEGVFSLAAFWERRIRRILPALAVMVFATFLAGWWILLPVDFEPLGKSMISQVLLLANVTFYRQTLMEDGYFGSGSEHRALLHTWSLAVEEQFYLLFPLLLMVVARQKWLSRAGLILGLGAGSLALSLASLRAWPAATFFLLPTRAWELLAGAWLAAHPGRRYPLPRVKAVAGVAGLGLILYCISGYTRATPFPGLAAVPPCLGAALVIFAGGDGAGRRPLVSRALAWHPLVFTGRISYSLYLWHWPLLVLANYYHYSHYGTRPQSWSWHAALLAASFGLAVASWHWIESPFRRRWLCPRGPQLFALAGGSWLTLAALGGLVWWQHGWPSRLNAPAEIFLNGRYDVAFRNDTSAAQVAAGKLPELGAQPPGQPVQLVLWGDSHAMHLAPVLDELCRRFAVRGVEVTHASTAPMLDYFAPAQWGLNEQAPAWSQAVVDWIVKNHVKTVILAGHWCAYGPLAVVAARMETTVRALIAAGATVYVVKDVPEPGFDVPLRASLTARQHGDLSALAIPQAQYAAANGGWEPIFQRLAALGATILDAPKFLLNTNGGYDVIRQDRVLYSDEGHLTVTGAKQLQPLFEPLFLHP